jgi:hypothetical protein
MPLYDLQYDPPAPIAMVSILNPANGRMATGIPMLLDSGSDITLIPQYLVEQLDLQVDSSISVGLVAFDGTRSRSGTVEIHVKYQSFGFRGRYVLTGERLGGIGRDILNFITLTLKGKSLEWEITDAS